MNAPQLDDGYTKIAHTILENAAKYKLNGTQFRILMVVWRSTYGWNKKDFKLSESYLATATEINRKQIQRELKVMIEMGILTEVEKPTYTTPRVIGFNKRYLISGEVTNPLPVNESATGETSNPIPGEGANPLPKKDILKHKVKDKNIYVAEIIEYLNKVSGKSFRVGIDKTTNLLNARWNEGFTNLDDYKAVIDVKCKEWLKPKSKQDKDMSKYVRPETLFGNKFESYLNEAPRKNNKQQDVPFVMVRKEIE